MAPKNNSNKRMKEEEEEIGNVPSSDRQAKKRMLKLNAAHLPSNRNGSTARLARQTSSKAVEKPEVIVLDEERPDEEWPKIVPKPVLRPGKCFPRIGTSGIYIELKHGDDKHTYQLHSEVLGRNSAWFHNAMLGGFRDLDDGVARRFTKRTRIFARFELFKVPEYDIEVVQRTYMTRIVDEDDESGVSEEQPYLFLPSNHTRADSAFKPVVVVEQQGPAPKPIDYSEPGSSVHQDLRRAPETKATVKVQFGNAKSTKVKKKEATMNIEDAPTYAEADVAIKKDGGESANVAEVKIEDANVRTETPTTNSETSSTMKIETDGEGWNTDLLASMWGNAAPKTEADATIKSEPNVTNKTKTKIEIELTEFVQKKTEDDIGMVEQEITTMSNSRSTAAKIEIISADVPKAKTRDAALKIEETTKMEAISAIKIDDKGRDILETRQEASVPVKIEADMPTEKEAVTPVQETASAAEEPARPIWGNFPGPNIFTPVANPDPLHLEAYNNLFLTFYSQPPLISTTDVLLAFKQSFLLVKVAEICGSLPVVRPYVNSALLAFGRDLYKAIADDPPTWMVFAAKLHSTLMFQEAMVHAVGIHPLWLWADEQYENLPKAILRCYISKCEALKALKSTIDKELFCATLTVNGKEVSSVLETKSQSHLIIWFVIQCWRDWFTSKIVETSKWKRDQTENRTGEMYRAMAKGGDAYLPLDEVMKKLGAFRGDDAPLSLEEALEKVLASGDEKKQTDKVDRKKVGDWLLLMKKQAQNEVAPLCVNHSLRSVEEAGFKYLTCTKVEQDELPWVVDPDMDLEPYGLSDSR